MQFELNKTIWCDGDCFILYNHPFTTVLRHADSIMIYTQLFTTVTVTLHLFSLTGNLWPSNYS